MTRETIERFADSYAGTLRDHEKGFVGTVAIEMAKAALMASIDALLAERDELQTRLTSSQLQSKEAWAECEALRARIAPLVAEAEDATEGLIPNRVRLLEAALGEAAESFNKIAGAALTGNCKPAFTEAIGALDKARAAIDTARG